MYKFNMKQRDFMKIYLLICVKYFNKIYNYS
jgi:hypothetical protein